MRLLRSAIIAVCAILTIACGKMDVSVTDMNPSGGAPSLAFSAPNPTPLPVPPDSLSTSTDVKITSGSVITKDTSVSMKASVGTHKKLFSDGAVSARLGLGVKSLEAQ